MPRVFFESVRSMFYRNTYFIHFFFIFKRGFLLFYATQASGSCDMGLGGEGFPPPSALACPDGWMLS